MNFYREHVVKKTRKPSACYWCQESIPVGSSKVAIACVWEGDFSAPDFHPECNTALEQYQHKYGRDNGWEWPDEGSMKRGSMEEAP